MNFKRIVSSALVCVMMFMAVAALLPVHASAAYSSEVDKTSTLTPEQVKEIVKTALNGNYATKQEMLDAELALGYLDSVSTPNGEYTIYVNRYTGVMYYKNNLTAQILTSNPAGMKYSESVKTEELLSQLCIEFYETSMPDNEYKYWSTTWSALYSQISVDPIAGGLRVSYTLGDTSTRFLVPGMVEHETFVESVIRPLVTRTEELIKEYFPDAELGFFERDDCYDEYGGFNMRALKKYYKSLYDYYQDPTLSAEAAALLKDNLEQGANFFNSYTLYNPAYYEALDQMEIFEEVCIKFPILKEGVPVFVRSCPNEPAVLKALGEYLAKYSSYTFTDMYNHEREVGYVDDTKQKPVIRCALEYTFNEDGSLSVTLPATSITFDETVYTLKNVICLPYLGTADMSNEGYALYPDGSGTIINFDDVYNPEVGIKNNMLLTSSVFGQDFCYATITGAHREQISMPVFGMVSRIDASAEMKEKLSLADDATYYDGFFAIVEEGASLSNITFKGQASSNKFITSYVSCNPYPSDTFDLSQTISVGSLGMYTITSESKYSGSYVTRFVMLSDSTVSSKLLDGNAYDASYTGMATYYRNYLYTNGTLSAVEKVSEDIPLYIEALGAMDVEGKFLTFPVTKKIPLTTFNDVLLMYKQLSTCKDEAKALWEQTQAKADAETETLLKLQYQAEADKYKDIYENAENISNINFKLTGFANGGMYYRYPAKLKWERKVGGKRGFENLLSEAAAESEKSGVNFGVYPDFNFMYIVNTGAFDGITNRNNVSRMVDNRYASKQNYNMTRQEYVSDFEMVISPDVLAKFFAKLDKKYSKYEPTAISLSTLGSDLNSNFDEKNPLNREDAREYVESLLADVSSRYSLMIEGGNAYTLKYASHILNASIDASHFKYASYTIPFVGMVLHGSVNYAGSALNYSGSPKYDILRAIESGASPYYVVCYENSASLKDDEKLSDYYSVNYSNWYASMVKNYALINGAIGSLQDYYIVDHTTLIAERVIDIDEVEQNIESMKKGILQAMREQLEAEIHEQLTALNHNVEGFEVVVVTDTLLAEIARLLNVEVSELGENFIAEFDALVEEVQFYYNRNLENPNKTVVTFDSIEYDTSRYVTESHATDKDYQYTDYTIDNGNIVMVTYEKNGERVSFILNYNIYKVKVTLADGSVYELGTYDFVKIG